MSPQRTAVLAVLALAACKPPPPAPQGLDESARYMVRNFWAEDDVFEAGMQGFLNWFELGDPESGDEPGKSLLGLVPGEEGKTTDAFTLALLTEEDVARLPLEDTIVLAANNPNDPEDDELGPRDLTGAAGVVSLAEMACSWQEAEQLLLRPDQNTVFPKDWDAYERTYVTPRAAYEAGTAQSRFTPITDTIDPYAPGFDPSAYGDTILFTRNTADPSPLLGVDMPGYPLALEFRHGTYDLVLDGERSTLGAFSILTYNPEAVWSPNGQNALRQSYSIEINLERPNGKTLRMLAVWAEPVSPVISADSAFALNYAVRKSRDSSVLLSQICAGDVQVEPEP